MLTRETTVPPRQDHANGAQEVCDSRTSARVRAVGCALAALALLAGSMTPVHHACAGAQPQATGAAPAPRLAVPHIGAYTGAYIEFGETEDKVTLERLEWFEKTVGKHQALIAFSSYWGQGGFPLRSLRIVDAYGAVPLLFWSPWEPPYSPSSSGKFSLDRILAGENDAYIDEWARQAVAWGKPMLVAWGIEMNGTWFPWSGPLNGGDTPIPGTDPVQLQGPEIYKRAYRYVVDRVRAQGARNVEWVFHANHSSEPQAAWNQISSYYPGGDYVDWVGISAYGKQFPWQGWYSFDQAYAQAYDETVTMAPDKPFILAEWGVGEYADGSKGAFIREAFERMEKKSPQLRAAVFWHERWQNDDLTYSNLHVHSSLESLKAYREGVANPFWLDRPVVENSPKAK
jgi:hypothetical protein